MVSDLTDYERSTNYIVDPHNYIMEEYCKQVQGYTWIDTITCYEQVYYVNNDFNMDKFGKFFHDNIDKFIDAELMDTIVKKAEIEFGLATNSVVVPFSQDALNRYMDVYNEHSGFNPFQPTKQDFVLEIRDYIDDNLQQIFSSKEYNHFITLLDLYADSIRLIK